MDKKKYEVPNCETVEFDRKDILAESPEDTNNDIDIPEVDEF